MTILKIRESFSPIYHRYSSIHNFESKWKPILQSLLKDSDKVVIRCPKIDPEQNCVFLKKEGDNIHLETSYIIGLDYIADDVAVMVEPKFDCAEKEYSIDFYTMLFESMPWIKGHEDISDIYHIDFSKNKIAVNQKDDLLTPILAVQFISYLHSICQKGLQKGYYWINENLANKIKGRILIKETLKTNHFKSQYNKTFCKYQEFGVDTTENQYLKYAFQFCIGYLNQFKKLKLIDNFQTKIGFIRSSLQQVTYNDKFRKELNIKRDPLFPEYKRAIELANLILKRSSFNITNTTSQTIETYPYWINMSKAFELHVLHLLRKAHKAGVYYQKEYARLIPDIIINKDSLKAIVDVKYKDYSNSKSIDVGDIRQVAGYARMKPIFKEMGLSRNSVIDSIIIYPSINSENHLLDDEVIASKTELKNYYNIFKLDVNIPTIDTKQ